MRPRLVKVQLCNGSRGERLLRGDTSALIARRTTLFISNHPTLSQALLQTLSSPFLPGSHDDPLFLELPRSAPGLGGSLLGVEPLGFEGIDEFLCATNLLLSVVVLQFVQPEPFVDACGLLFGGVLGLVGGLEEGEDFTGLIFGGIGALPLRLELLAEGVESALEVHGFAFARDKNTGDVAHC